ncbi:hypothetical protein AB0L82_43200 [Nocardia sp. NPDC052001]|uniref:hypothetical protein n=1 Tax=Nocardia sp. NPDC052001 TaxID=3154853 RepID=UPI003418675F
MAVDEFRYICTNCMMGWHNTPYCPFPRPAPPRQRRYYTDAELRTLRHLRQLEKDGVISPAGEPWIPFRWVLWPMLALLVFFALLIIF